MRTGDRVGGGWTEMNADELKVVLEKHGKWLRGERDGVRANLRSANLSGAYLHSADLSSADLRSADLSGANLSSADLSGAKIADAILGHRRILPEEGKIIGWKKLRNNVICKLDIDCKNAVSSLVGRKCRTKRAKVLAGGGISLRDESFKYTVGRYVTVKDFDDDIRVECTRGIHFFLTRAEAEEWS